MMITSTMIRSCRGNTLRLMGRVESIISRDVSLPSLYVASSVNSPKHASSHHRSFSIIRPIKCEEFSQNHHSNFYSSAATILGIGLLTATFGDIQYVSNQSNLSRSGNRSSANQVSNEYEVEVGDDGLPNYGSSNDPIPYDNEADLLENCYLAPIEPKDVNLRRSLKDNPSSDYNKSLKALETVLTMSGRRTNILKDTLSSNDNDEGEKRPEESLSNEEYKPHVVATSLNHEPISDSKKMRYNGLIVSTNKMYFAQKPRLEPELFRKFVLLGGPSSEELSCDIALLLGTDKPSRMIVSKFNDGETRVQIQESVRGKQVFLIQSTTTTDSLMELLLLISTLRRASAKKITAVIPYYGYSRQDKRSTREPIAAADVALLLEIMGVDQVFCVDLHSDSLVGFFPPTITVEHLMPIPVAAAYFHEELTKLAETETGSNSYPKVTVVAAHEGQVGRATQFRSVLQSLSGQPDNIELAVFTKSRIPSGMTHYEPKLVGDVAGRKCILVDDIVNTGTTLSSSVKKLKHEGAESIFAWATHGVFGNVRAAPESIQNLQDLEYLLISNSIVNETELPNKIRILNIAPLLAEAISRALKGQSPSEILDVESITTNNRDSQPERYDND